MSSILRSKAAAWGAIVLVVLIIIFTFRSRHVWWAFIDEFFMFMAAFCQLVAVYIERFNRNSFRKLQFFAIIFGILMVIAIIIEIIVGKYFF